MDKRCNRCGEAKPLDAFYADKACRDGRRPECKACMSEKRKEWYRQNREREIARVTAWQRANPELVREAHRRRRTRPEVKAKERAGHLRRKFDLTPEQYDELLAAQGGGCAVCGRKPQTGRSLHVDHDHESGAVRGLLCFSCNASLGHLRDDRTRLQALIDYLDAHDPDVAALAATARARLAALRR